MKKKPEKNPLRIYLALLFAVIVITTCITTVMKSVGLVQRRTFTGNEYTVLVFEKTDAEVIFVSNSPKRVVRLKIENVPKEFQHSSLFEKSLLIGVPLDASISMNDSNSDNIFTLGKSIAYFIKPSYIKSDRLGELDFLKLSRKLSNFSDADIITEKRAFKDFSEGNIDPKELFELFKRDSIINDKTSITVVNASGQNGLARRVELMLEAVGYYIIAVDTQDKQADSRIVFTNPDLKFYYAYLFALKPEVSQKQSLEDIRLILGENLIKK